MKNFLFSIFAAWMMISCKPTITHDTNTDQNENFISSLKNPVEKPEQEW